MSDKPADDPTRWYPLGQYVEDEDDYSGKRDDDTQTFTLARSDMAALNRFTQTGRKLPLSRATYQTQMGLTSESELTDDVWAAVDKMLVSFKTVSCAILMMTMYTLFTRTLLTCPSHVPDQWRLQQFLTRRRRQQGHLGQDR